MKSSLKPEQVFPIYGSLIISTYEEAKSKYFQMMHIFGDNGKLTVKDVYDVLEITLFKQYRGHMFGWRDPRKITITRLPDDKGRLYIPKRECLE